MTADNAIGIGAQPSDAPVGVGGGEKQGCGQDGFGSDDAGVVDVGLLSHEDQIFLAGHGGGEGDIGVGIAQIMEKGIHGHERAAVVGEAVK